MCRTQGVLVLAALYVRLAHSFSWDFAAVSTNQIEFYANGSKTHSRNISLIYIYCNFYDEVSNKMFMVDTYAGKILSYDMATEKTETSVDFKNDENSIIMDIAFDPVEQRLFWIEVISRSIKWFSLTPGSKNDLDGNFLFNLHADDEPIAIAVDSCRRYIYWLVETTSGRKTTSRIERARLDGSKRELVINDIRLPLRNCLAIDQQTLKIYWIVGGRHEVFSIERADLNGNNKEIYFTGTKSEPSVLTISKGYIYLSFLDRETALQLPNDPSLLIITQTKEIPIGRYRILVTSNKIDDQSQGCEELRALLSNKLVTDGNASTNISSKVSVCQNNCFNGNCTASAEEEPECRCNSGYSGERCEVNMCQNYCLHEGVCSLNENRQPICQCYGNYGGERCEVSDFLMKCFETVKMLKDIINTDVTSVTFDKVKKSTCDATVL